MSNNVSSLAVDAISLLVDDIDEVSKAQVLCTCIEFGSFKKMPRLHSEIMNGMVDFLGKTIIDVAMEEFNSFAEFEASMDAMLKAIINEVRVRAEKHLERAGKTKH